MAQGAVVDVQDARPGDRPLIDAQSIAVVEVVVDEGRQQVVGGGDGVEISRQVQIHALGRNDAGPAGTAGAALDTERGAHGGLAQSEYGAPPAQSEALSEADRGRGLALSGGRGGDTSDDDVVGLLPRRGGGSVVSQNIQGDLGDVAPVGDDMTSSYAGAPGQVVEVSMPGEVGLRRLLSDGRAPGSGGGV